MCVCLCVCWIEDTAASLGLDAVTLCLPHSPSLPFPSLPAMSFAYLAQHLLVASAAFVVVEQFMIHCGLWFTFPRHQIAASKTNDWHNSHANDFEISFIHPRTHTHTPLCYTHSPRYMHMH